MDAKYEALFTPWKVGNVEIKNRIVMCPMGGTSLFGQCHQLKDSISKCQKGTAIIVQNTT